MNGLCCTTLVPSTSSGTRYECEAACASPHSIGVIPRLFKERDYSCSAFNSVGAHDTVMPGPDAGGFEE